MKKPKFWNSSKLSIWVILLFPFAIIYLVIFNIKKFQTQKKFPIPVICVGNIYLGGTGKTPLVSEIFKITKLLGKNPAFVKKYYDYLEDEINLLKKIGTTFVSNNRIDAIERLIKNNNDLAILDDGFQDFTIKKNFSIICFNQKQWIGNGLVIPCGPLREGLSAIKKADCIFINGKKDIKIENQIYNQNKEVNIFYSNYKPINLQKFKNKKIFAFAGIGNPSNFFDILRENNLYIEDTMSFPDHYKYSKKDLDNLAKKAKLSDSILVTTEKDYLRIDNNFKKDIECFKIEIEIEDKENFIQLIKKIYENH